jgi:hypothetical protein
MMAWIKQRLLETFVGLMVVLLIGLVAQGPGILPPGVMEQSAPIIIFGVGFVSWALGWVTMKDS